MDAYVLVYQAEDDVIYRLNEVPQVRFAARTVGAHVAVAVFSGSEITDVVALVERAHEWGVVAHETAIPLRPNPPYLKGLSPKKHEVFIGLTVNSPYDRVQRAVQALRQLEVTLAVHAVAGRYQIMAELGSMEYHELRDALLLDVPAAEGIGSITSSLAVFYPPPEGARPAPDKMDWFWRDPDPERPMLWGGAREYGA